MKVFTYDEVAKHGSRDDCYVILYNKVYDLTEFIPVSYTHLTLPTICSV